MLKPILGSWFEFHHCLKTEGTYWNPALAAFTCEQWREKIREIAGIGMEYLVLMHVAEDGLAYYDTPLCGKHQIACENPLEAVLSACDEFGVKFFVGLGYFTPGGSPYERLNDPQETRTRLREMSVLTELFGHHDSFFGWYWPHETYTCPGFCDPFIEYVNNCSREARKITPQAKTLIAPYGVRVVVSDDRLVRELERMDCDIIAYQDGVGVRTNRPEELPAFYEGLRKAHDRAPKTALWADMEIFEFEGEVGGKSPLIPASFSRIERQIESIAPFVDTILVYQYPGMMNRPGSKAFAGHVESPRLYTDYVRWLSVHFPEKIGESARGALV